MRHARFLAGPPPVRATRPPWAAIVLAAVLAPATAGAGQVSVSVNDTFFAPKYVSANPGDHVTWVWYDGSHSVTSGDTATCVVSGPFHSGTQTGAGRSYSWKIPGAPGTRPYFCLPHCSRMRGLITYTTPVPVADFRISEIRYTLDHQNDFVEITNIGPVQGDLARYRLSMTGSGAQTIPVDLLLVPPNGRVVVRLGRVGTNTPTEIFLAPIVNFPTVGSVALYVPMTVPIETALTRADLMVDFVQWGAGGQQNEATAVAAGRWVSGEFVPTVADGHSIAFCGTPDQVGQVGWAGIEVPNPGTADCSTPAARSTWGRLRVTYR